MIIFILIALICVGGALFTTSQATMGVGLVCLACLFGIFARLMQADEQDKNIQKTLKVMNENINILISNLNKSYTREKEIS